MAISDSIVPTACTLFPPSAGNLVLVEDVWHPQRSSPERPAPSDGWEHVGECTTRDI